VDVLYMLVPLSVVLVFAIVGVLAWSIRSGQFDDVEREGERILLDDAPAPPARGGLDSDQGRSAVAQQNPPRLTGENNT
jgi:cbb3-type cytochrome oxidase maturation protein